MSSDPKGLPPLGPGEVPISQAATQPFAVDLSQLSTVYANFCRVTGTHEELILDFGLNSQTGPTPNSEPIKLTHRLVMNFYNAKRLLHALHMAIQHHERLFGALEVDVQRRMRGAPPGGGFGIQPGPITPK
jgi:hypothetical protein